MSEAAPRPRPGDAASEMPPAVVLVGGRGTRLGRATADTPKPMLDVAGQPFLHWVTLWLVAQGVREITFLAGFCGDQVARWAAAAELRPGVRLGCRIEAQPLGTGGAVLDCIAEDAGDVLVLNGDSLLLCDLGAMVRRYRETRADAIVALFEVADASRYGSVTVDADGRMTGFGEKRAGSGRVNGGLYILGRRFRERFPRGTPLSMEFDLFPQALLAGLAVMTFPCPAPFIDIGTPETLADAADFVRNHRAWFELQDNVPAVAVRTAE